MITRINFNLKQIIFVFNSSKFGYETTTNMTACKIKSYFFIHNVTHKN